MDYWNENQHWMVFTLVLSGQNFWKTSTFQLKKNYNMRIISAYNFELHVLQIQHCIFVLYYLFITVPTDMNFKADSLESLLQSSDVTLRSGHRTGDVVYNHTVTQTRQTHRVRFNLKSSGIFRVMIKSFLEIVSTIHKGITFC